MKKWPLPVVGSLGGGLAVTVLSTYFVSEGGTFSDELVSYMQARITTAGAVDLMTLSLTAGALVLAVWGFVASISNDIIAKIKPINEEKKSKAEKSIDALMESSITWFLSFCSFLISYAFLLGLDKVIDLGGSADGSGFVHAGFLNLLNVVGDDIAAPAFFFTGFLLLAAGALKTVGALYELSPLLALHD